jgi:sarcosine oxidase
VIVVGLGAAGSAAAWRLALDGHRVTGFDRWHPPHPHGSTHGETRVTRVSAWEGAHYVPLAARANVLWDELERDAGARVVDRVGGVFVGHPHETIVAGSRASVVRSGVPFEDLDAAELVHRVPGIVVPEGMVGFADPGAGILFPERIVEAELALAARGGAELRFDEPVLAWRADGDGVAVTTARGTVRGDRLILATGAWMHDELAPLGTPLRIERQTMLWFASTHEHAGDAHRPVLITTDGRDHATVIFPPRAGLVKAGGHGPGEVVTADDVDRTIRAEDYAPTTALLAERLPRHTGAFVRGATCLYTCTPDGHFVLDRHPVHPQVVLASPCNGFGFKFSSAVGEALAALATEGSPPVDLTPWRLRR